MATSEIIDATLCVPTHGLAEALFSIGSLDGRWSASDTWSSIVARIGSDDGFEGLIRACAIAANRIEEIDGVVTDLGVEVPAGQWVTFWAASGYSNHGLCVRRLAGESTDLSEFLIPESVTAELVIVYRRR